jgi:tRNA dimethylallyltransferase
MDNRIVIVTGPTAVGKTHAAVALALKIDGEIVSADSMQIYRELKIGTARPDEREMKGVKHHMVGIIAPDESYSVARYQREALDAIDDILARQKRPIVAGGTGLYINALTYELDFTGTPGDEALRNKLSLEYDQNPAQVYDRLLALDPSAGNRIHINDKKRVVRRLEIQISGGAGEYNFSKTSERYDFSIIGLRMEREKLVNRINKRVDQMFEQGLEAEAGEIYESYGPDIQAFSAIGYKEFLPYLEEGQELVNIQEEIKKNTRRFAKRQMTWFRRDERIQWLDAGNYATMQALINDMEKLI